MRVTHYSASLGPQSTPRRLALSLLYEGVDTYSLMRSGTYDGIGLLPQSKWGRLIRLVGRRLEKEFLHQWYGLPFEALWTSSALGVPASDASLWGSPDILHLHWIADGALDLASIARFNTPIVWTMHDTWPFTGGCHILNGCEKYREVCARCPVFPTLRAYDYVAHQFALKYKVYQSLPLTVVSPSRAFLEIAKASAMMRSADVRHIPNCIDATVFRPIDKGVARQILRLPEAESIVMLGAMSVTDLHKGMDLALDSLQRIAANVDGVPFICVSFGGGRLPEGMSFPVISLGSISDQTTLALAYSAADIFVCPSREESFSQTTLESLACGTPVVGFSVGGIPDMIEHGVNGYLAAPQDTEELAAGIAALLRNPDLRRRMGEAGREKVEREFSFPVIARKHIALYEDILEARLKQPRRN